MMEKILRKILRAPLESPAPDPVFEPDLDLQFARDLALDHRITFTRASTATFVGSNGLIQSASNNVARFDHDPITGERLGLLLEGQKTNRIKNSEDLTAASWAKVSSSIVANSTTAPDGTTTADKFSESSSGTGTPFVADLMENRELTTSTDYSFSCFLKNNDARYAGLTVRSFNGSNFHAEFDLQEGVIVSSGKDGNSTFTSAKMEKYGNGWYRCEITGVSDTSDVSSDSCLIVITQGTGISAAGYAATFSLDGSSIFVWGAQLETNVFVSSYIPTSGITASRSRDLCEIPVNTFRYSQTEGTILMEARKYHDDVSGTYIFYRLSDGTNSNSISVNNKSNDDTKTKFIVKESGGNEVQTNLGVAVNQDLKTVFGLKKDDFIFAVNGEFGTDTSGDMPQGITEFAFGKNQAESFHLNGHFKQIQYFARRLSDETILALSQPSLEPSLSLVFDSSETSFVDTELTR